MLLETHRFASLKNFQAMNFWQPPP